MNPAGVTNCSGKIGFVRLGGEPLGRKVSPYLD